jgi:hypothetical protein
MQAFDTIWHLSLIYELLEFKFSISVIKHIYSFLSWRKFRIPFVGEISTARDIQARVPQDSGLSPTFEFEFSYIPQIQTG